MPTLGLMSRKDMDGFEGKIAANLVVRVRPSGFHGLSFTVIIDGIPETNDPQYYCSDVRRVDNGSVELEYNWEGGIPE